MSLADALLNLTSAGMNSRLANMETEPHIVIGEDRFVHVPDELKRIAVQYDHRVETVTFDCPRYWDGYDMSKMKIYINYTRADGLLGMYLAENVFADEQLPNIMHFDWTLTRNVTGINGPIVFMVCVKRVDREGNEEVHWNSERNLEMYISEGLEGEEVIQDLYPDIFTQMLQRMDEIEEITSDKLLQIEGIHQEYVVIVENTKTEFMNRTYELEAHFDDTHRAFIDRTGEIEDSFTETQEMVKSIEKVATPEAMQNYVTEYYGNQPGILTDVIDGLYSMAVDQDIDDIIDGDYVEVVNKFEDKMTVATDEDIDSVINNKYVGTFPDDPGDDDEEDDALVTDKELDDLIGDLFDDDDADNELEGSMGGVTDKDLEDIVGGLFN